MVRTFPHLEGADVPEPRASVFSQAGVSGLWEQLLGCANLCQQGHGTDLPGLLQKPWPAPIRKLFRGAEGFEVNPEETAPSTPAF